MPARGGGGAAKRSRSVGVGHATPIFAGLHGASVCWLFSLGGAILGGDLYEPRPPHVGLHG